MPLIQPRPSCNRLPPQRKERTPSAICISRSICDNIQAELIHRLSAGARDFIAQKIIAVLTVLNCHRWIRRFRALAAASQPCARRFAETIGLFMVLIPACAAAMKTAAKKDRQYIAVQIPLSSPSPTALSATLATKSNIVSFSPFSAPSCGDGASFHLNWRTFRHRWG